MPSDRVVAITRKDTLDAEDPSSEGAHFAVEDGGQSERILRFSLTPGMWGGTSSSP
jgi:hypothetical protein